MGWKLSETSSGGRLIEKQVCAFFGRTTGNKVIEDVKVTLARRGAGHSTPLEVVVEGLDTGYPPALGELELRVLAEMRGVGVKERAGVAKRLQNEFGGRDLVAELRALLARLADAELEERLDGKSAVLRLAAARLTSV